ncbi:uncharacterized protein METZ01_LOCUS418655 [marine metagenome]|uniref:Uncharacterized protein n=1 Tax=marine metagenome TaxID=408172 RepID=A0A382X6B6_9ZZZZ
MVILFLYSLGNTVLEDDDSDIHH